MKPQNNLRKELVREFREFPFRSVLLRMAADFALVNVSMLSAFVIWFLFYVTVIGADPRMLAKFFKNFIQIYWLFWSLLAILIFHLSGFYTKTRAYASRHKLLVVFRAVTMFVVLLVFFDYLVFRGELIPRGVAIIGWGLTVLTVTGSRLVKDMFLLQYSVRPRNGAQKIQRVLVVGGAGYLGSALVPQLLLKGFKVRAFDSLLFGEKSLAAFQGNPNFELATGDMRDIQAVVEAMRECEAVVHLAAIVGDPACEENKDLAVDINRVATRMLIEIAKGYGVNRLIFASTCSVYGASDFLVDELTLPVPISTYARTKVDSEEILLQAKSENFHPVVLRLGTLFGLSPRPRFDLVVNVLTAKAATTGEITIFNGDQWRPFLHVSDAARAFVACLEAPADVVSGQIFNVGDYRMNCRLSDLSHKISDIIPTVKVENIENADRRNYRASFDKIHNFLGFTCQITLEDGIREIYNAILTSQIPDFTASQFNNQLITKAYAQSAEADKSTVKVLLSLAQKE